MALQSTVAPIRKCSKRGAVLFLIVANVVFFAIPLFFVVIGVWRFSGCPGNANLPPLMMLIAILIVVDRAIFWRRLVNETHFEKTFPKPEGLGSTERLKTWRKNRQWSTSRKLLCVMENIRLVFFVVLLGGLYWSVQFVIPSEKSGECDGLIYWPVLIFSALSLVLFVFACIGNLWYYCVMTLSELDEKTVSALNRVL